MGGVKGMGAGSRAAWYVLLSSLLVVVATWPAVLQLPGHVGNPIVEPDMQVGLWWPSAFAEGLIDGRNPFFARSLAWPAGQNVTLLLWNFGAQLLFAPIHLLTDPIFGMNLVSLLTMVLNGLACGWAGAALTRSRAGAIAALIVGAANGYAFLEGYAGRPEQALWAPVVLYLAGMLRLRESPGSRRDILLCATSLAAAGAIYWFYAYFLVLLTGLAVVWWGARRQLDRRGLKDLALVGLGAAVFVLPFLLPVVLEAAHARAAAEGVNRRTPGALFQIQAALMPASFLGPLSDAHNWSKTRPSILLLPLCLFALIRGRGPVRLLAACALVAAIFALGPVLLRSDGQPVALSGKHLRLPGAWLNYLPGYSRLWWPHRWMGVAVPALALMAGWGVARLPRPRAVLAALALWTVVECAFSIRVGLPPRAPLLEPVRIPAGVAAIARLPGPAPVLQVSEQPLLNGMVVWQALLRQPVNSGIAWHIPGIREATGAPVSPLEAAVQQALRGEGAPHGPWSPAATGGLHDVLLLKERGGAGARAGHGDPESQGGRGDRHTEPVGGAQPPAQPAREESLRHLRALLGEPFFNDTVCALWTVPGIGLVPQDYGRPAR